VEIWIEFNRGGRRVSPDPARVRLGAPLWWRFRCDDIYARRLRWTIYFTKGHPFAFGGDPSAIVPSSLVFATETFRLTDRQHVGTSPVITADVPGEYKYGVRLEDLDENREIGDEDPFLEVG